MDRLDQYRVFIRVAEMGSFVQAAHSLELPRASVSAAVQHLESRMGVRLLHRTTRQVRITAEGEQLLARLRPLLAGMEDLDQLFQPGQRQVAGCLVVDVPSRIARRLIAPALPGLLRRHPRLRLVLRSTDRAIDPVREGVDCVVRVGQPEDSSLIRRPLGRLAMVNCASPSYLREQGEPRHATALVDGHWAVGYASPTTGRELTWEYLAEDGRTHRIDVPSRVVVNNAESYIACCQAGIGLVQVPRFDVQHLLDSGRLVEVIPDCPPPAMPLALLHPPGQRSRRLAAFQEWFAALLQPHLAP